jgi:cellulose synthase/poly-beta-1,6-N-acetylglucosamine synthase-like glycosyltransferase
MTLAAGIVFWVSVFMLFYIYVGYSITIAALALVVRRPVRKNDDHEPTVTFLIAAYNEEQDIARKLDNTLELDYPHDKLEILVASDGSTDRTDEIVREYAARHPIVRLHRVEGRVGKTITQNSAVETATGEIIIFSDAPTEYRKDAIRRIARNYADPEVGAVSGRYYYVSSEGSQMGIGTIVFWKYENTIKGSQTRIRTVTGCSGCIYSVRKDLYVPLRGDLTGDLVEPLKVLEKGYRIVFEPEAVAIETTTEKSAQEWRMRLRVINQGMNGVLHMKTLLNPFRYPFVSFQLFSHKILRWLAPVFMVTAFVANAFLLGHWFYNVTFALQALFYLMALLGWIADALGRKSRLLSIPHYFCLVNVASLVSLYKIIRGERVVVWEPIRS